MSELTKTEKTNATKLIFAGFIADAIATTVAYLNIIIIMSLNPLLAGYIVAMLFIGGAVGCALTYVWLGDPNNKWWKKGEELVKGEQAGE